MLNEFFLFMKTELALTAIIFFLLIIKIGKGMKNETLLPLLQWLLLANCVLGFCCNKSGGLFGDMFQTDGFIAFQKNILCAGVWLISLVCSGWLKKTEHMPEFFMLMLSALLGMCFMLSAGNLLMFYLGLELSTIPVAAMANFDLERKKSSEAAMKMILSSAFSSGILLFGISLLYGATGTLSFHELPQALNNSSLQILAFIMIFTAFAFKLSVAPFHLWTADVYEGSPIAVTAFLSVISKGAMAFLFTTTLYRVFQPMHGVWHTMLVILALATMFIGNLFAIRQQQIKRFLAFSSIAQVGFILVAVINNGEAGLASVVYFVIIYICSNLAALGVADIIATQTGRENIDDYRGMYKTNPLLCWVMALALFSLAGIPPAAGFFGKLFLITAGAAKASYTFITLAALNMIISLYYYLRVVRAMFMEKNETPVPKLSTTRAAGAGLIICTAGILLLGFLSFIYDYIIVLI
jgi:NADH-quinone oxidoreductase subunit N